MVGLLWVPPPAGALNLGELLLSAESGVTERGAAAQVEKSWRGGGNASAKPVEGEAPHAGTIPAVSLRSSPERLLSHPVLPSPSPG